MLQYLATQGLELAIQLPHTIVGGVFTVLSIPSTKVKAGKGVYFGDLLFTFTGGSSAGVVDIQTGTASGAVILPSSEAISPSSNKVTNYTDKVLLEGDNVSITLLGYTTSTPVEIASFPVTIYVKDANQTKAKGQ